MGGVTSGIQRILNLPRKDGGSGTVAQQMREVAPQAAAAARTEAIREQAEDVMARRRARRGGRALLSEARLNPEQGVGQQTLGTGPM